MPNVNHIRGPIVQVAGRVIDVAAYNAAIENPCPRKPLFLGLFMRETHKWHDISHRMNTMTYSTLDACTKCSSLRYNGSAY